LAQQTRLNRRYNRKPCIADLGFVCRAGVAYVALPFVVSYDGSAPSGVVTIGDFAARRIDLD